MGDFNGDGAPDLVVGVDGETTSSAVCLSPLGKPGGLPSVGGTIVFTCDATYQSTGSGNSLRGQPYLVDVLGDGHTAHYSQVSTAGTSTLLQGTCLTDEYPPAVLRTEHGDDGEPSFRLNNYVGFTQMVDFTGIGKPYDVRWSSPHYTAYTFDDGGATTVFVNRWDNLQPTISITGFNLPLPLGSAHPGLQPGSMKEHVYATKYPSPAVRSWVTDSVPPARPPYIFDEPFQGAGLSADFSGSGYGACQ